MLFRVLGPIEVVRDDGAQQPLGSRMRRLLLAVLIARANQVVDVDRLAEALWGESQPSDPTAAVHAHVHRLRRDLGTGQEHVVTRPPGYVFLAGPDDIDADVFARLVTEARTATRQRSWGVAADKYRSALDLWRGEPYGPFSSESWIQAETTRLEELRLAALQERVETGLTLGLHAELVPDLFQLVDAHPFEERFWAQLILALYRSDRQAEALDAFKAARATLIDELGIEPGPELQRLEQRVLEQDPDLAWTEPAPSRPQAPERAGIRPGPDPSVRRGQLAPTATPFVGREQELSAVIDLLQRHRLVSICGPGGVGKTRLAMETTGRVSDGVPDGVWHVGLAGTSDPDLVVAAIASAVGLDDVETGTLRAGLKRFLRDKEALLLVDNCEHLLESVAVLGQDLIETCPDLTILATSREPLAIPGEAVYRLSGLPLPDPDFDPVELEAVDATRLLAERARAVRPDFQIHRDNCRAVAEICRIVDGLPLALELVAARLRMMTPDEALAALDDQLRFLATDRRGVPDRHRTLRGAIAWSYELLGEPERDLLCRLAVFRGGFDLEAVAAIVPGQEEDPLELLSHLVDKSLVAADFEETTTRYTLSEPIRSYAHEQLARSGAEDDARRAHAEFYLHVAEEGDEGLSGPDQQRWVSRLELEHDNLRATWQFHVNRERWDSALDLARRVGWFHLLRGHLAEGRRWLETALDHADAPDREAVAEAHATAGVLAGQQGDAPGAREHFEEALELRGELGDDSGCAAILANLSLIDEQMSEFESQRAHLEEAISLLRAIEAPTQRDTERLWACQNNLAGLELTFGRLQRAEDLARQVIDAQGRGADAYHRCRAMDVVSQTIAARGEPRRASRMATDAIGLASELGDRPAQAQLHRTHGEILTLCGEWDQARDALETAIEIAREIGDDHNLAGALLAAARLEGLTDTGAGGELLMEGFALVRSSGNDEGRAECLEAAALLVGDAEPRTAALLLGAADEIRRALQVPPPVLHHPMLQDAREHSRQRLGEASFEEALEQGSKIDATREVLESVVDRA